MKATDLFPGQWYCYYSSRPVQMKAVSTSRGYHHVAHVNPQASVEAGRLVADTRVSTVSSRQLTRRWDHENDAALLASWANLDTDRQIAEARQALLEEVAQDVEILREAKFPLLGIPSNVLLWSAPGSYSPGHVVNQDIRAHAEVVEWFDALIAERFAMGLPLNPLESKRQREAEAAASRISSTNGETHE
jgi:hypothetical protein